ncbi:hypothetical protein OIDMADRAFT_16684 [Oidiodendron maius Zn]|uniref:Uncharacterized protein n=1 Tax=Oidiodendron maius (strain Zn) TaxID=913774 RepID=A0A0C3I0H6_OIDMZ|nr:hypothetical protein OIDMADRAFT_16684 [Oidiodendron maius Zn]
MKPYRRTCPVHPQSRIPTPSRRRNPPGLLSYHGPGNAPYNADIAYANLHLAQNSRDGNVSR